MSLAAPPDGDALGSLRSGVPELHPATPMLLHSEFSQTSVLDPNLFRTVPMLAAPAPSSAASTSTSSSFVSNATPGSRAAAAAFGIVHGRSGESDVTKFGSLPGTALNSPYTSVGSTAAAPAAPASSALPVSRAATGGADGEASHFGATTRRTSDDLSVPPSSSTEHVRRDARYPSQVMHDGHLTHNHGATTAASVRFAIGAGVAVPSSSASAAASSAAMRQPLAPSDSSGYDPTEFDVSQLDDFRALHPRLSGAHSLAGGSLGKLATEQAGDAPFGDDGADDDSDDEEDEDDARELQRRNAAPRDVMAAGRNSPPNPNGANPNPKGSGSAGVPRAATRLDDIAAAALGADPVSRPNGSTLGERLLAPAGDEIVNARDWFAEWDTLPEKYLASVPKSYFAFFKAFVGAGILFLPKGFQNGGLLTSVITFGFVTWLSTICMIRMTQCKDRVVRDFKAGNFHGIRKTHKQITFGMIARASHGRYGRWVVDGSIALSQLGFAGSALIFSARNIEAVILAISQCAVDLNPTYIICIIAPLLIPFVWIRQLTKFAVAIVIADGLIVLGILYILTRNIIHIGVNGVGSGITQWNGITGFFVFFGAAIYALEGTAFVLPINLAMRDKSKSDSVITNSSILVGCLYCAFGTIGYLAYGSSALTVVTLNLQQDYRHDITVTVLQIGYCTALLLAYPVTMYPAIRIIEPKVFKDKTKSRAMTWKKNALRGGLVLFTAACAILGADQFENFVGMIGGLACVPLTLLFPALFHLRLMSDELTRRQRYENYLIVVVGTVGFLATSISSAYNWATATPTPPPECIPL